MTRAWSSIAVALIAGLTLAVPARADDAKPAAGDIVHGGRAYRLDCAACHGLGAWGDGPMAPSLHPAPAALRDGSVLFAHSDDDLIAMVLKNTGMPPGTPEHGQGLSNMDVRDILVWLKQPVPEPGQFFPEANRFIAHKQTIDQYGLDRIETALGHPLPDNEKSITIFTLYKPADGATNPHPGHATKLAEDPAILYTARPADKLGFVAYMPLTIDGTTVNVAMAMNRNLRLTAVETLPSGDSQAERLRLRDAAILKSYVGSGGRVNKRPVRTYHGGRAPAALQAAMLQAFERFFEGATMFGKEEQNRFWAEPDALKMPPLVDDHPPTDVETASTKRHHHRKKHR